MAGPIAFLVKNVPQAADTAIDVIRDGIEIIERHPFVGRPCEEGLRARDLPPQERLCSTL
jgi:hypothetical protein